MQSCTCVIAFSRSTQSRLPPAQNNTMDLFPKGEPVNYGVSPCDTISEVPGRYSVGLEAEVLMGFRSYDIAIIGGGIIALATAMSSDTQLGSKCGKLCGKSISDTFPIMLPTLDLAMKLIDNQYKSGSNSAVEFLPSKQAVAGSNPVSRSTC